MIKAVSITGFIFLICLAFATPDENGYKLIESATPGILGALLGGLTAGISVIFSVLITVASSSGSTVKLEKFFNFLIRLKHDLVALLICLVASLILPYLRVVGIPLLVYPSHDFLPERDTFYTALELTSIAVSVTVIFEVVSVMFLLICNFQKLMEKD
ncbi:hypothetical protein [Salinivibrio proteolyticus]|uniref:hypothetical protein n=1 Tax=Salinivibrio proteolyticus TaxID=334715 RepID=UPI000988D55C|nr:hypothetical protein [Salinivibrio proteolyticus]OOF31290.1 hypothetical protein BZJ20_07070 [Salinivibrio proteolyticus]